MDLSIEMTSQTKYLEDALSDYTHVERLDKDNKWHCDRCQGKVKADKQLASSLQTFYHSLKRSMAAQLASNRIAYKFPGSGVAFLIS